MRILSTYLLCSFLISIEYAILYDSLLINQATTISALYNDQIDSDFRLETEIYANSYIYDTTEGENLSEKIKNFINALIGNNPELKYLLILGDENSFPPIYINNNIPSDDFYAQVDSYIEPPLISIGRIPTSELEKVQRFTDKLSDFLTNPTIGAWRDKVLLIADDENKNGANEACEIKHTLNSDILYDILSPYMDVKTLYGIEYEATTNSDGLYHEELNQDIIDEINSGIALINYIGHGDQKTLSAEKIIDMERDMGQISIDDGKLGLWIVGTCKFGEYDESVCMAEELITDEDASIGVISTVRSVTSSYNIDFLEDLFIEYSNHFLDNTNPIRIGDIMTASKTNSYNENINFYQGYLFHLFGDPALPIFSSKQQTDYSFPETINIAEKNTLEIMDYDLGNLNINFTDYESDLAYYGDPTVSCDGELIYSIPGTTIFKNNFTENSCYTIPLDAMSCNNCNLKMRTYYQNSGDYNGVSYVSGLINLETDENLIQIADETGPTITFSKMEHEIYNNSIVPINSNLTVHVSDTSGINIYNGIGHNLRYWFNNEVNSYIIESEEFNYTNSCLGIGHLNILIPNDYVGYNTINFEAWDNYNNRTIESIDVNISNETSENYIIDNLLTLPNPFKENTYFTFQVPKPINLPIDVMIKIFNLNGALIKTINSKNVNELFNSISWNGKDNLNQEIPNGSYIAYVKIVSNNGKIQERKHVITKIR